MNGASFYLTVVCGVIGVATVGLLYYALTRLTPSQKAHRAFEVISYGVGVAMAVYFYLVFSSMPQILAIIREWLWPVARIILVVLLIAFIAYSAVRQSRL